MAQRDLLFREGAIGVSLSGNIIVDTVVVGVGTGGTATGLGRALKPRRPSLRLIGVCAQGSYLGAGPEEDRIAGITPDFEPWNSKNRCGAILRFIFLY